MNVNERGIYEGILQISWKLSKSFKIWYENKVWRQ